jgi:hypothetical protein
VHREEVAGFKDTERDRVEQDKLAAAHAELVMINRGRRW